MLGGKREVRMGRAGANPIESFPHLIVFSSVSTRAIFLGDPSAIARVWGPEQRERLRARVEVPDRVWKAAELPAHAEELNDVEVVFSTWGMPRLEPEQLGALSGVKAVFYAAGTVRGFADPLWERGITVCSAWTANGVPVAEFTLAQIILALKQHWTHVRTLREARTPAAWTHLPMPGAYRATVGLLSLGVIGRRVVELLRALEVRVRAYDPFINPAEARALGVELASLESIFQESDVVSIHTPWLKETERLVTGGLIRSMKPGATLINTSRGAVVAEDEMIAVLRERADLTAVLDVTHPEPPVAGSPLYTLPNVLLSPHIAGSCGLEVRRMAEWMADEFEAWQQGRPLKYVVTREMAARMA